MTNTVSESEVDAQVCPQGHGGTLHRGDEHGHQYSQSQSGVSPRGPEDECTQRQHASKGPESNETVSFK